MVIVAKIKSIIQIYGEQKSIEQMASGQDEPHELELALESSFILFQSLH